MKIRLRRRLIGVCAVACIIYLFAVNSQVVWLYLITAFVWAMVPIGLEFPLSRRWCRLELSGISREGFLPPLTQDAGKAFIGDSVRLHFRYHGDPWRLRFGPATLEDGSLWPIELESAKDGRMVIAGLASQRGDLHLDQLTVSSSWPLGLIHVERRVSLKRHLLVHPRYRLPAARKQGATTPGWQESSSRGTGTELIGVREYRPGDAQRHIHWPTTARRNSLMVVETARETENQARYELAIGRDAPPDGVELAVSLAASLAASRAVESEPFVLSLAGGGPSLESWTEALAALARFALPSALAPAWLGRETGGYWEPASGFDVRITAAREVVLVETRKGDLRLAPATKLEDALAATMELR